MDRERELAVVRRSSAKQVMASRGAQPSAALQGGEHVVHVGAGTGYYTAIMAPSGRLVR
jgi:protein-L-isoaspartate O-methyltransferase